MPMKAMRASAVLTVTAFLSGCASTQSNKSAGLGGDNFGEAYRQTLAAQIKDPAPVYDSRMTTSGRHAAQAVERYRTDRVKRPDSVRTSKLAGGGSSSDSSGSDSSGSGSGPSASSSSTSSTSTSSSSVHAPPTAVTQNNNGAINPVTGEYYAPAGQGYVGTRDGTYYAPAGPNGVIDTRTGKFIPKVP